MEMRLSEPVQQVAAHEDRAVGVVEAEEPAQSRTACAPWM